MVISDHRPRNKEDPSCTAIHHELIVHTLAFLCPPPEAIALFLFQSFYLSFTLSSPSRFLVVSCPFCNIKSSSTSTLNLERNTPNFTMKQIFTGNLEIRKEMSSTSVKKIKVKNQSCADDVDNFVQKLNSSYSFCVRNVGSCTAIVM